MTDSVTKKTACTGFSIDINFCVGYALFREGITGGDFHAERAKAGPGPRRSGDYAGVDRDSEANC